MFVDELELFLQAGHGGSGCVSFRREKYVEFGGPDGGDGGHGGSVTFRVRPELNTLLPLRQKKHYRASRGGNGKGSNMTGRRGRNVVLNVPPGTIVRDRETGTILGDLVEPGQKMVVAQGGRGGKGNRHFASSTQRAPRFAQAGEAGEELWVKLELKVLADVGLVGFPNAGKSTLISRISAARPKVASYPFTTLQPQLGVVPVGSFESFVVADIPGIIEGAHEGAGLGLRFLRHIERTNVLLVLVDPSDPERGVEETYTVLMKELQSFSEKLARKTMIVGFSKEDVPHEQAEAVQMLQNQLRAQAIPWHCFSSVRGDGIQDLVYALYEAVKKAKAQEPRRPVALDSDEEEIEQEPETIDPLDEL